MSIYKNKKLSFLVLICFFIFFMGQKAKEEKGIPIVTADTGFRNIYDVEIIDDTLETSFASDPVLKFHVPPSPKSYTLLFKWWTTFVYAWSGYEERHAACNIYMRAVADIIPFDHSLSCSRNIDYDDLLYQTGYSLISSAPSHRDTTNAAHPDHCWARSYTHILSYVTCL